MRQIIQSVVITVLTLLIPTASFALVPMLPLVKAIELPPPNVKPVAAVELPPPDVKPVAALELKPVAAFEAPYSGQTVEVAQAETNAQNAPVQNSSLVIPPAEETPAPLYPVPHRTGSKPQDFDPGVY